MPSQRNARLTAAMLLAHLLGEPRRGCRREIVMSAPKRAIAAGLAVAPSSHPSARTPLALRKRGIRGPDPGTGNSESDAVPRPTVTTKDGKTYAEDLLPSKGSPQNPMTYDELEREFMGLATRVMPKAQASMIAATIRELEKIKDLRNLTNLLVSPSGQAGPAYVRELASSKQ